MTLLEELMQTAISAADERKRIALRVLRGETVEPATLRPATGPLLLGMGEGAELLGVSRSTFWRAMRAGRIQRVEVYPGSFRVRREDVEFLAARAAAKRDRKLAKA